MKILVTSGNGLLGRSIKILTKDRGQNEFLYHTKVRGDLNQSKVVEKLLLVHKPDLIIHNAATLGGALTDSKIKIKNNKLNLQMFLNFQSNLEPHQKLLSISSYHVYSSKPPYQNLDINRLNFSNPYSNWKSSEIMSSLESQNIKFTILPHLFGISDNFSPLRSHFIASSIYRINKALEQGDRKIDFYGSNEQVLQFATGLQAADFVLDIACKFDETPEKYLIGNVGWVANTFTVFKTIVNLIGYRGEINLIDDRKSLSKNSMYFQGKDSNLGILPTEFISELDKTILYFQNQINKI
jgi:nucleoside-diphosphate-sugar epimerase